MNEQRQPPMSGIELPSSSSGRTSKSASPSRTIRKKSTDDQESLHNSNPSISSTRSSNSNASTVSAATASRMSSSTKTPATANDNTVEASRDRRQRSGNNIPQWPVSPRLKSPPPVSFRSISGRRAENENTPSNTSLRRLAPVSSTETGAAMHIPQDSTKEATPSQPIARAAGRGASTPNTGLETVNEASVPSTPMTSILRVGEDMASRPSTIEPNADATTENSTAKDPASSATGESNTRRALDKTETAPAPRSTSTSRPPGQLARRSLTSLTGKSKPAVEPLRSMTVETEPVNSTAPVITDRARDSSSIKTRPSTETIRPKKDKKRPTRKVPSLHAGTSSSKADIFEAKVASAVDEADSSDSDETFVYESNPPEPRHTRHHSRTPSANSLASQMDLYGTRGKHGVRNNSVAAGAKRGMKFSSSIHGNQLDAENTTDGRSSARVSNSTTRHHHINRHGRNTHTSIIDTDSPFNQAHRSTSPRTPTMKTSTPSSPRASNGRLHFSRKAAAAGYDTYDDGADDERAPLMGSARRNRHSRRPHSSHYRPLHFEEHEAPGCFPRFSGCFFIGIMVTLISIGIIVSVVILNRTLTDVSVLKISNVIASEQELMLDLLIRATNPNLFPISVSQLDVNLFAESPFVGTSLEWANHINSTRKSLTERRREVSSQKARPAYWFPPFNTGGGVDEGTDPIDDPGFDDPEPGNQKMLLGRVLAFDSPLVFDPSPLRHFSSASPGEIRLRKPGSVEKGGLIRWERVIQHDFELIVRGVIKYQLPLSSAMRSARIGGRIKVSPNDDSTKELELLDEM